jgi:uncharacterized membrane protein YbhN (UPF0104 family)
VDVDRRALALRLLALTLVIVAVAAAVAFLPFLQGVRNRLAGARPAWIAVAFLCQLGSVGSYVAAFRGVFGRELSFGLSYHTAMVEQGANVLLPTGGAGGVAIGAVALQRAGLEPRRVASRSIALFLLTSGASVVTLIAAGAGTALGLFGRGIGLPLSVIPAALGVVGVIVALVGPRVLPEPRDDHSGIRRQIARVRRALRTGVSEAVALLRKRDPLVVGGSLGYLWFDIASLAAAFHAFGGGGPVFGGFVLAYILGQLGALIPIPGGIGGTDGGLIGFMAVYGSSASAATAAVLAFRVFQLGVPAILGTIALGRLPADLRAAAGER